MDSNRPMLYEECTAREMPRIWRSARQESLAHLMMAEVASSMAATESVRALVQPRVRPSAVDSPSAAPAETMAQEVARADAVAAQAVPELVQPRVQPSAVDSPFAAPGKEMALAVARVDAAAAQGVARALTVASSTSLPRLLRKVPRGSSASAYALGLLPHQDSVVAVARAFRVASAPPIPPQAKRSTTQERHLRSYAKSSPRTVSLYPMRVRHTPQERANPDRQRRR